MYNLFVSNTATTEIYTLSLHDALPISPAALRSRPRACGARSRLRSRTRRRDRKSTRLNSSHLVISYAVFCLKKKDNEAVINMLDEFGDGSNIEAYIASAEDNCDRLSII